ncbi:MAG TPA: PhzF family phenazine biosynthesis protein [Solirubrobacteraceae bacterium]|nr:PhzF family phenazine biosynthesis protein [Solirubrobacteraceae bacterium]
MHPYEVLDVFTEVPLQGNPLAVFTEAERIDVGVLQRIARELNLSETVFVFPPDDPATADARVRIFTPTAELPFAGHPVLGTAFVLASRSGLDVVRLVTGSGTISIELMRTEGRVTFGEMAQPIPTWAPFPDPEALLKALGVGASGLPIELYDNGSRHAYVELPGIAAVTAVTPDMNALLALGPFGVSCFAVNGDTVRSRMFGPGLGVPEDPATGSAAGPLAVQLARHERIRFGQEITITQGVEIGRPSELRACAFGSAAAIERVTVGGAAVFVARGELRL